MAKELIEAKVISGIDKRHSRRKNNVSDGQNFLIRDGSLITRPGTFPFGHGSIFTYGDFPDLPITSSWLGSYPDGIDISPMLMQTATRLWYRTDIGWHWITFEEDYAKLSYTRHINRVFAANGVEAFIYDLTDRSLVALDFGETMPDAIDNVISYKAFILGWASHGDNPNYLYYTSIDLSPTNWPALNFLDISGQSGDPIIAVVPFESHLFVLTQNNYYRVYGTFTGNDTVIQYGGKSHVWDKNSVQILNNRIFWLGSDKDNVVLYTYTGTHPVIEGREVGELLQEKDLTSLYTYYTNNQYWLVFPGTGYDTEAVIYDFVEDVWLKWIFPFKITHINTYYLYNAPEETETILFLDREEPEDIVISVKLDYTKKKDHYMKTIAAVLQIPIVTEFTFGNLDLSSRRFKPKSLYLYCDSKEDFELKAYLANETGEEQNPVTLQFSGNQMNYNRNKLPRVRCQVAKIRITTEDYVDKLQRIALVVNAKNIK